MLRFRRPSVAALALLLACTPERQGATAARRSSLGFTPAESLYYLDPKEGCDFLPQHVNPDPVALVREYDRRDNEGQFLQSNSWLDSAYDCPGHLPGPDEFTVVRETRIVESHLTDSLARIVVQSAALGIIGQDSVGSVFRSGPEAHVDTFVVVRTPYGWRSRSPQLPDNVLASWVLAHPERIRLRPSTRDSLAAALAASDHP